MTTLRHQIALGVVSATSLAFQLALMQLLSFCQWYHFAYMVISVALLGGGCAGIVICLFHGWAMKRCEELFAWAIVLAGFGMTLALFLSQIPALRFDSFILFTGIRELIKLPLTYFLFFLPCFFSSVAIGLALASAHHEVGRIYGGNLAGAAAGAALGWGLLWLVRPEELPAYLALVNVLAVVCCLWKHVTSPLWVAVVVTLLVGISSLLTPPTMAMSEYKALSRMLNLPGTKVEREVKCPYGIVHILFAPKVRYAPAISLTFLGVPPTPPQAFVNGDAAGPYFPSGHLSELSILDYSLYALPWALGERKRVMVPLARAGEHAAYALYRGAETVAAFEAHPVLASLVNTYPSVTFMASHPRSRGIQGYSFYDLVLFPPLGIWGGNAGMGALEESYLYTVEGIRDLWKRLAPRGVLMITCWEDYPVRYPLKIWALLKRAVAGEVTGTLPEYLAVVRGSGQIAFLLKRTPFLAQERRAVQDFCRRLLFEPLTMTGERASDPVWELFPYLHNNREIASYPFDLRPPTDDRPYIHHFLQVRALSLIAHHYGWGRVPFFELGYLIVLVTLVQVIVVAVLFMLLPLCVTSAGTRFHNMWRVTLYFSGIGLGYMVVEMAFIQRFALYFGAAVNAVAVVVAVMLVASGVGSWYSSRFSAALRCPLWVWAMILFVLVLYSLSLTPFLMVTVGYPMGIRLFFTVMLVAPPAFLMGIPFPVGIRILDCVNPRAVAWAWGINGFFSVVGTCVATLIAVEVGFRVTMLLAGFAYMGVLAFRIPEIKVLTSIHS